MKLLDLVTKYINSSFTKAEATEHILESDINIEIPTKIIAFIKKFHDRKKISPEEFALFSKLLSKMPDEVQYCINHLLYRVSHDIYQDFQDEINNDVNALELNLHKGAKIPKNSGKGVKNYIGLLNCYQLITHHIPLRMVCYNTFSYPDVGYDPQNTAFYRLPFAINVLRLVGKLPKSKNFHGYDLSNPCYPLHLDIIKNDKVPLKKGIKASDEYYPYKMVSKIAKGATGDNTLVATNGKKILFVRGVETYSPNAVLASKIATLISPIHFSSERLLDNHLVASKESATYVRSVCDPRTRDDRKKYIEEEKRIFPGTGIIEETMNFVLESDKNTENFGFSSTNVFNSHLSKIDFDNCTFSFEVQKSNYEQDLLTKPEDGIYHGAEFIHSNTDYIKEKLFARLKLSMLTEPLFAMLADKAYAPEDEEAKNDAVQECKKRADIALELLFEHPHVKDFLTNNPTVLMQCCDEIKNYISKHFEVDKQELLQSSLQERTELIQCKIKEILNIDLSEVKYEEGKSIFRTQSTKTDQQIEKDIYSPTRPNIAIEQAKNIEIKSGTTFFARNWLKLLGITVLTLIGVGAGLGLVATGIFAPLGVGAIGLSVGAAIGFGSGLIISGSTLGTKMAYDEYQYRSNHHHDADKTTVIKPSPSVQSLLEQLDATDHNIEKQFVTAEKTVSQIKASQSKQDANNEATLLFNFNNGK